MKDITTDAQDVTITTKIYPELVSELGSPLTAIYDTKYDHDIDKKLLIQAHIKSKIISSPQKSI